MPLKSEPKRDPFTDDLIHCARCGRNHEAINWKPFQIPVVDDDGTVWGWWALCPDTQEPVLLTRAETLAK